MLIGTMVTGSGGDAAASRAGPTIDQGNRAVLISSVRAQAG